jgi:hypothetical protein
VNKVKWVSKQASLHSVQNNTPSPHWTVFKATFWTPLWVMTKFIYISHLETWVHDAFDTKFKQELLQVDPGAQTTWSNSTSFRSPLRLSLSRTHELRLSHCPNIIVMTFVTVTIF